MGVEFESRFFLLFHFSGDSRRISTLTLKDVIFRQAAGQAGLSLEATAPISCVMKNRKINRRAHTQKHTGRFDFFIRLMSKSRSKIKIGGTLLVFFSSFPNGKPE